MPRLLPPLVSICFLKAGGKGASKQGEGVRRTTSAAKCTGKQLQLLQMGRTQQLAAFMCGCRQRGWSGFRCFVQCNCKPPIGNWDVCLSHADCSLLCCFCSCSCERRACVNMLKQKPGVAVVIFPGGAAEALVTEQFKYKLVSSFEAGGGGGSKGGYLGKSQVCVAEANVPELRCKLREEQPEWVGERGGVLSYHGSMCSTQTRPLLLEHSGAPLAAPYHLQIFLMLLAMFCYVCRGHKELQIQKPPPAYGRVCFQILNHHRFLFVVARRS
jgi:hypothetical protein